MGVVIEVRNLYKTINDKEVVKGLNFSVSENECIGLLGPNGSGKSTTLEMISGSSFPSNGDLFILGMNGRKNMTLIKKNLGVLPQENIIDTDFSVIDNLIVYGRYFGLTKTQAVSKARDLLRFTRLEEFDSTPADSLEPGQKKKLSLALALVNDPKILFLDEPSRGMEPEDKKWMWQTIESLKLNGLTLLMATQSIEEAERLCDRIMIVDKGRSLCEGRPGDLITETVGEEVVEFQVELADLDYHLRKIKEKYSYQVLNNRVLLFIDKESDARRALEMVVSDNIMLRRASLDDVFLKVAGYDFRPKL